MNKETMFAEALQEIKELAKEQGNLLSREQVETKMVPLELSKDQMELVYEYLASNKIGVEQEINLDDYLTKEEKDYLFLYLEEIERIVEITSGEREALLLSAMAGDEEAQKKVIELFLPKVVEVAKLYSGQGVFLEDLIGEGNIALTIGSRMLGCLESPNEVEGMLGKMMMDAMEESIQENMEQEEKTKKVIRILGGSLKKAEDNEDADQ